QLMHHNNVTVMNDHPRARLFFFLGLLLLLAGFSTARAVPGPVTGTTGGNAELENRQPTLGIEYMICIEGIFPNTGPNPTPSGTAPPDRNNPFLGEIRPIAFGTPIPGGWTLCRGQILQIAEHTALFSLIGTTFGGDGS